MSFSSDAFGKTISFVCIQKFCFLLGALAFILALVQFLTPRFDLIKDNIFALFQRSCPLIIGLIASCPGVAADLSNGLKDPSSTGLL